MFFICGAHQRQVDHTDLMMEEADIADSRDPGDVRVYNSSRPLHLPRLTSATGFFRGGGEPWSSEDRIQRTFTGDRLGRALTF